MFKKDTPEIKIVYPIFPQLPNGLVPTAVFCCNASTWRKDKPHYIALIITPEAVIEFTWDGVAKTFHSQQAYIRYDKNRD